MEASFFQIIGAGKFFIPNSSYSRLEAVLSCAVFRMNLPREAMTYVDPDTGFTMLPGTMRPDGTFRKPRR